MATLKELLPPAKSSSTAYYDHTNDPWFKQRFSSEEEEKSAATAAAKQKPVPPYLKRAGFVPRRIEDFGDGGAFPEIHVAQYPLDMGREKSDTLAKPASTRTFSATNLALQSSSSKLGFKSLKLHRCAAAAGSALGARMVSAPAVKAPALLDFDTKVFKKEKINLAGHDEVFKRFDMLSILYRSFLPFPDS